MTDKKELVKEYILNNPNLSTTKLYEGIKGTPLGMRKTNFLSIVREVRQLPEPSIAKKESSIPVKHRTTTQKQRIAKRQKPKPTPTPKPKKIPYEQTKFGKIAKGLEKTHGISEKKAIKRARALLKIPRKDYNKLNRKDVNIILSESP